MAAAAGVFGARTIASGNAGFVKAHGGSQESRFATDTGALSCPPAPRAAAPLAYLRWRAPARPLRSLQITAATGLLLHGQTDEQRAARDAERAANEARCTAWRAVPRSVSQITRALLEPPPDGNEAVPAWLQRRFRELGVK